MWNFVVLAALIAATGVYANRNQQTLDAAQGSLAASTAADMGIYRSAVIDYFSDHDLTSTSVSTASLKSGGYLPEWSRMYQQSTPLLWRNYRDADGVIYVYAASRPAQDLNAELAQLARNSVLLGFYRSGLPTLQSPVSGDTGIPITALSPMSIQDGAPVWIAMKK
jgi:hypothetical protein